MEKTVNVKEFKVKATKFFNGKQEVIVTKYGKPIALVTPIKSKSIEGVMLSIGDLLQQAGLSAQDVAASLSEVRRKIYGSRRS